MSTKTSVELVDIDSCLRAFDGNRFKLILGAATRAREIAGTRIMAEKNNVKQKHPNKPIVTAMIEIADGKIGKEYLQKVR
jgi:DNA-directed RNA polymerase omega subunit